MLVRNYNVEQTMVTCLVLYVDIAFVLCCLYKFAQWEECAQVESETPGFQNQAIQGINCVLLIRMSI